MLKWLSFKGFGTCTGITIGRRHDLHFHRTRSKPLKTTKERHTSIKIPNNALSKLALIGATLLMISTTEGRAQVEMDFSNLTEVTTMPTNGIFWSLQLTNFPPSPFMPFPGARLWEDGAGNLGFDGL
jgi:hypothetical protein